MLSKRIVAAALGALLGVANADSLPPYLVLIAMDPTTNASIGCINGYGNFSSPYDLCEEYIFQTKVDATTGLQYLSGYGTCTVSTPGWSYVGCALDQGSPRLLSGWSESVLNNTLEQCLDICASKGYTLAGVEYT